MGIIFEIWGPQFTHSFDQKVIEQKSFGRPSGFHIPDKEAGQETIRCTAPSAGIEEPIADKSFQACLGRLPGGGAT